jgi:hypothetical protein
MLPQFMTRIGSLRSSVKALRRLHANEVGAEEGMNKLLIFAMVALPLLALLIFFGKAILNFAQTQWTNIFGGGDNAVQTVK